MKKRTVLAILLSVLAVVLVGVLGVYFTATHYLSKINYEPLSGEPLKLSKEDIVFDESSSSDLPEATDEQIAQLEEEMQLTIDKLDAMESEDVMNVLILGMDSRYLPNADETRTDMVLLLSINRNTKEVIMSSILRDTALMIPEAGVVDRLCNVNLHGGTELVVKTIEENYKVKIDKYIKINFYSYMDMIDAVGGITYDVTDEHQREMINMYIKEMNRVLERNENEDMITECGEDLLLNGMQSLGYVRNMYSTNDVNRTGFQRETINKLWEKVKSGSYSDTINVINTILPNITTDFTTNELFGMLLTYHRYLEYDVTEQVIPIDGTWEYTNIRGANALTIDLAANAEHLRETIYHE